MKKILSVILVLVMVLSLCACAPGGEGGSASKGGWQVGYGRVDITPKESVPLKGYGNTWKRMSTGFLDYLYATALAIKDVNGEIFILMGIDSCTGHENAKIKEKINAATGIPTDHIITNVTHSHSTPDFSQEKAASSARYGTLYIDGCAEAAITAVEDLKPATIGYTTGKSDKLNFVRHVKLEDGNFKGDNFGHESSAKPVEYMEQIDETIHLIKIDRGEEEKPIVLMSWRAHASITGGASKPDISADFVGSTREYVEKQLGCNFMYLQGCAGNVNPRSYITEDDCTRDYKLFGQQLGGYVVKGLENELDMIEPCTIKSAVWKMVTVNVDHTTDHLAEQAKMVQEVYNQNLNNTEAKAAGAPYGIYGNYHAIGILKRVKQGATMQVKISGMVFGDQLAIVGGANELFSSIGVHVKEQSSIPNTIVLGYTDGQSGYMPVPYAYDILTYEAQTTAYARDSSEKVEKALLELIEELKTPA